MELNQDDDDLFDSLLNLEDHHYSIGYEAGYRDGEAQSAIEGRIFGIEKGFEKFLLMGKLRRKAEVWSRKYTGKPRGSSDASNGLDKTPESKESRLSSMNANANANARLDRHIGTLLLLTDSATLDKSNMDDAVAEFDDRLKRAQAKVKIIQKILGEDTSSQLADATEGNSIASGGTTVEAAGVAADIENLKLKPG